MEKILYRYFRLAVIIAVVVVLMDIMALCELSFCEEEPTTADGTGTDTVTETEPSAEGQLAAGAAPAAKTVKKPAKVKIRSISSKKEGQAVVKWKKTTCTKYQIQYSRYKSFSQKGSILTANTRTAATLKGLAKGKRYYFRVRAMKKYKKEYLYGPWSDVKSVKIHKHAYKLNSYLKAVEGVKYTAYYKCSCGSSYYRSKTKAGKIYKGIITRMPSCRQGILKARPKSSNKYIPAVKAHVCAEKNGKYVCSRCGMTLNYINTEYVDEENQITTNVEFTSPKDTNQSASMVLSVKNQADKTLEYKLYYQKSSSLNYTYTKYKKYLAMHGCSTCALTSVLNATVPAYKNYTPDMVIEKVIRPAVGEKSFKKNFSKKLSRQMPIGLKGITKVLKANGVRCKYVHEYTKKSAEEEIRAHLESGNPVIFTLSHSFYCDNNHTMCMLGLDKNGKIIVGDSIRSVAKKWGKYNRLVKFNTLSNVNSNTVKNVCKYFKYSLKDASNVGYFYSGKKGNIGYVLVWLD